VLHRRNNIKAPAEAAAAGAPTALLLRFSLAGTALCVLASAGPAGAQVEDRLADCARIAGSSERLACYDALSEARRNAASQRDWNRSFGIDAAPKSSLAAESAEPGQDNAPDFGFEERQGSAQQIQSRYDGQFTGWSGNTLFRLENGQVWKQSQSGRVSARAARPAVTIKRTTLGGYRMNVEGVSESIRVERVK
jgi:hypothetical protein